MTVSTDKRKDTAVHWDAFLASSPDDGRTALTIFEGGGWRGLSYGELRRHVEVLSSYLIAKGVAPGDRIAVLSESRPQWGVALFAVIRAGAVAVPLDVKLTVPELAAIVSDASPRILFVSSAQAETAERLRAMLPSLGDVVPLDDAEAAGWPEVFPARERHRDETAIITYTSGTTGTPKGVMTTFGNLLFQVEATQELYRLGPRDVSVSLLPLNHLLELVYGFLAVLYSGGTVCYASTLYPQEIARIMREQKVTRMVVVPLFLKLLKEGIEREVEQASAWRRRYFRAALALARWLPRPLKRLTFGAVHRRFGGALKEFVSGGAALGTEVAWFFHRLGLPVYQGYGLTETIPGISVNTPGHNRIGSVGRPLPGVEVRILKGSPEEDAGEIITRGPHVMRGYYLQEELTKEVLDADGWLHTGDLGWMDSDGPLHISGQSKSLIVLAGGKNVVPEEVEGVLAQGLSIKEACVVGRRATEGLLRGTEQVWVMVVPAEADANEGELREEVERLGQRLAPYKRPVIVVISPDDLPKTATLKVKRALVHQWLDEQEVTAP